MADEKKPEDTPKISGSASVSSAGLEASSKHSDMFDTLWTLLDHKEDDLGMVSDEFEADQILPHLFLGNVFSAGNWERVQQLGVTHVVSCIGQSKYAKAQNPDPSAPRVERFDFQALDRPEYPMLELHADGVTRFIDEALEQQGKVLVHCMAGQNRSAALVVAYLMTRRDVKERMCLVDAVKHVAEQRKHLKVLNNKGFLRQLVAFADQNGMM